MQSKQVACKPPRAVFDKKKIYINILHEFTPRIYPMTKTNYFVISQIFITTPGTRMNNLIAPINPNKKQDKRNIDIFQLSHPLNINNSIHPHKMAQSNLPRPPSPIRLRQIPNPTPVLGVAPSSSSHHTSHCRRLRR